MDEDTEQADQSWLDECVAEVSTAVGRVVPQFAWGAFLVGSWSRSEAVLASDVDLAILVDRSVLDEGLSSRLRSAIATVGAGWRTAVDAYVWTPSELAAPPLVRVLPEIKYASRWVGGVDLRSTLPEADPLVVIGEQVAVSCFFMFAQRGSTPLSPPLDHPDRDDEFYGRVKVTVPSLYHVPAVTGTKELVKNACFIATASAGINSGIPYPLTPLSVADRSLAELAEELKTKAKKAWNYQVPEAPADRLVLRNLAGRLTEAENQAIHVYRRFLNRAAERQEARRLHSAREAVGRFVAL